MANPFATLDGDARGDDGRDDGESGDAARGARAATAATRARRTTTTTTRAAKKRETAARRAEAEAMRARAHAAMAMEKREDDRWGKVAKGSGIARKAAKEMAKTMTTTAARDDDDATGETTTTTETTETTETTTTTSDAMAKVSEVFWHTFEDTGASCWCVRVEDEDGESTTMSITKSVPRARKIPSDGGERPVLVSGEIRLLLAEWDDRTRIDRARRAKAKLKAAKAAAKAAAEAAEAPAEAPAVETSPAPVAETLSAAPPGFGATRRAPPPGFEKPAFRVVHVPVVDPAVEARQRELEAQVAALQAQLAAQQMMQQTTYAPPPPSFSGGSSIW